LAIDMIAQSARYPSTVGSPVNFVVEGDKRYSLHLAIHRFTGMVIDQQIEVVKE